MFQSYLFPISYAFMAFPVAALFFTLPFLIVQYRRHGYINKIRAVMLYLLLLYLMNAIFLVLLPLPESRHNLPRANGNFQYIPLHFIQDILDENNLQMTPSAVWTVLRGRAFLQIAFNVVLTIPFGMFLGYYFRTKWVVNLLFSFGLSLFFEVTQITGIYGFYDHPYRVFDVDDLISNTLGGILGYMLVRWISGLLPRIEQLDTDIDYAGKRVTYTRRGLALMIDSMIWMFGLLLTHMFFPRAAFFICTGVYFILLPYLSNGRTVGKWIVRIQVKGRGDHIAFRELLIRYGLLYWVYGGVHAFLFDAGWMGLLPSFWRTALTLLVLLADCVFLIHVAIGVLRKDFLFYESASRTSHAISWPASPSALEPGQSADS